jgi:hypothetical protein
LDEVEEDVDVGEERIEDEEVQPEIPTKKQAKRKGKANTKPWRLLEHPYFQPQLRRRHRRRSLLRLLIHLKKGYVKMMKTCGMFVLFLVDRIWLSSSDKDGGCGRCQTTATAAATTTPTTAC